MFQSFRPHLVVLVDDGGDQSLSKYEHTEHSCQILCGQILGALAPGHGEHSPAA